MSHPDEGILHAFLDGELEAAEASSLEVHLAACAECQARLAEARAFRDEAFLLVESLDAPPAMVFDVLQEIPGRPESSLEAPSLEPLLVGAAPDGPAAGGPAGPSTPPAYSRASTPPRWIAGLAWAATVVLAVTWGYLVGLDRTGGRTEGARPQDLAVGTAPERRPASPPQAPERRAPPAAEPQPGQSPARSGAPRAQEPGGPAADTVVAGRVLANLAPRDTVQVLLPAASDEQAAPPAAGKVLEAAPRAPARTAATPAVERVRALAAERPADDSMIAAIRILGGSLRLVEGLVPERIEVADSLVRVYYLTAVGGFVLEEWREAERIQTRVRAQPGTPRDSILAWSRRIR